MPGSLDPLAVGQCALGQPDGVPAAPGRAVGAGQAVPRVQRVGVRRAQLPLAFLQGSAPIRIGIAFALQITVYTLWTVMALAMNGELKKNWRLLLAVPLAPAYMLTFAFLTTLSGIISDVFLFGNVTKFAPESTLIVGRSTRIAIMSRVRRSFALLVRSAIWNDVPFGLFWFGWNETKWTPSGFLGWTTGKRPSMLQRLRHGAAVATETATLLPSLPEIVATKTIAFDVLRESVRIAHVAPANAVVGETITVGDFSADEPAIATAGDKASAA